MLVKLQQMVQEVGGFNVKLILLVGPRASGKSQLLRRLSESLGVHCLNLGWHLGTRLATTPIAKRSFMTAEHLRDAVAAHAGNDPLLIDNLEVLFEPSLQINPLELVKRLGHSRPVVAVWPGELRGDRLVYADMSHPEHRDYSRDGVVVFEI